MKGAFHSKRRKASGARWRSILRNREVVHGMVSQNSGSPAPAFSNAHVTCDRRIGLRSLGSLMHGVVANDLEGPCVCRPVLPDRRAVADNEKFSFPVDATVQLAAIALVRLGVAVG